MNVTFSDSTLGRWLVFRESCADSSGQRVTKREVLELFCRWFHVQLLSGQKRNKHRNSHFKLCWRDTFTLITQVFTVCRRRSRVQFVLISFIFLDKWKEELTESLSLSFFDSFTMTVVVFSPSVVSAGSTGGVRPRAHFLLSQSCAWLRPPSWTASYGNSMWTNLTQTCWRSLLI